jgi:DNA polymerase
MEIWADPKTGYSDYIVMIIGEAPGMMEDLKGEPFVGQSGKLINKMLKETKVSGVRFVITNAVKCRPPANRTPEEGEIKACKSYLMEEIRQNMPDLIVTLGKTALISLEPSYAQLTIEKARSARIKTWFEIPLLPTYHPAAGMRNPIFKTKLQEDLAKIKPMLKRGV